MFQSVEDILSVLAMVQDDFNGNKNKVLGSTIKENIQKIQCHREHVKYVVMAT